MSSETALDSIVELHLGHMKVCNLLERIADALPQPIDPVVCDNAVEILVHDVPLHRREQEEFLFPLLRERALPEDDVEPWLQQLCAEHVADEGGAMELVEVLPELANREPAADPNAVGHMLRSFFQGFRHHLIWEQHLIFPLAESRLTTDDIEWIETQMRRQRQDLAEESLV